MTYECAGEESHSNGRIGVVTEIPGAAVERIHKLRLAGYNTDGHTASENFPIRRQIRADVEQSLAAAGVNAETRNNFIKNQRGAGVLSDFTDFAKKFARLEVRMTALHGLDENRG